MHLLEREASQLPGDHRRLNFPPKSGSLRCQTRDESNGYLVLYRRLELPYSIVGEQFFLEELSLDTSGLLWQGRNCSPAKDDNLISEFLFRRLILPDLRAYLRSSRMHGYFNSAAKGL